MGLFLIFLNILCAVLYGIAAYASYIAGLMGRASINLFCCICWIACAVLNSISYRNRR